MIQDWYRRYVNTLNLTATGALLLTILCIFSLPVYMMGISANFTTEIASLSEESDEIANENFTPLQPTRLKLTNIDANASGQITVNLTAKDNLINVLSSLNTDLREIKKITQLVKPHKYQKLTVSLVPSTDSNTSKMLVENAVMIFNHTQKREFFKDNNILKYRDSKIPLTKKVTSSSTIIRSNLVNALKNLGLSKTQITELVNAYSYNVDFQRGINIGAKVTVLLEKFENEEHHISQQGKVLFASLETKGKSHNLYWYEVNGKHQYFTEQGKTTKRVLLRSPLNVAKISSGFGPRKSPFGGFSCMHKGVDFSAPTGTPIYAAGNGVVGAIGWMNGYGKYVEIKHEDNLTTRYAHISKFANITKGTKVEQGTVIAYVGATGKATGPHLHYEVRVNGTPVDPMKIKTMPNIVLKDQEFAKFEQFKHKLTKQFNLSITANNKLAAK